ncbi:Predicted methyltransferase [Phaffia rhodozyma]|uniref:Predicted methyltransferase n=1 Tax=Phaffia rhodozyma TaxID=264483 RepID=A0A0F7SN35_PHARH|nr:Predicted methyltransferase [Phaffia rhodozyma]
MIVGNQPFGPDLVLNVRRPVLIPRPETEEWASRLADLLTSLPSSSPRINLLDLCTGTGCIPLLICKSFERANRPLRALGVDILPQAVDLAKENARLSGIPTLPCTAGRNRDQDELLMTFDVRKGDMFDPSFKDGLRDVWGNIDVLTSNPPYIPLYEIESLDENVRSFESPLALLGDLPNLPSNFYPQHLQHYQTHGLDFYLQIAHLISAGLVRPPQSSSQTSSSSNHRTPQVILEVGYNQASAVKEILKEGPAKELMESVEGWKDFAGIERVVVGFLKERS